MKQTTNNGVSVIQRKAKRAKKKRPKNSEAMPDLAELKIDIKKNLGHLKTTQVVELLEKLDNNSFFEGYEAGYNDGYQVGVSDSKSLDRV